MADFNGHGGEGGGSTTRGDLLLVDNDARIVELLSWFLGNQGFTVRVAGSFAEARERLAERMPELVISDVDLGVESATVELPKLSAEGILPPTLVVSGFLDESVRRVLFGVPEVLDTLPKPFEFPDLEAKVAACLAGEVERTVTVTPVSPSLAAAPEAALPIGTGVEPGVGLGVEEEAEDDEGWIEISPGG